MNETPPRSLKLSERVFTFKGMDIHMYVVSKEYIYMYIYVIT